jgi:predicted MFS family arabinose efflux permease
MGVAVMTATAQRPSSPPSSLSTRFGVSAGHEHYKWWALSCTSLGMLLAATNSGTLIIALPDLERSLHASLLALVWVILAYLIAATVLVLMAGRLSDLFGRKRAYVGGFLLFAFASLGAGFSGDATVLILWRIPPSSPTPSPRSSSASPWAPTP